MRLICPNCDAQYEVDDGAVPPGGRDVQCSNCGHAWFQMHADALEDAAEDDTAASVVSGPAPAGSEMPPPPPVESVPEASADDPPAAPPPAAAPAGPVRRTLDENLLVVLREEAAREAAERRAEAGRSIETQPDLGPLEAGTRAPVAAPPVAAMTAAEPDHPATQRPNPRRDLLPDIEEINSTLRPGSVARDEHDAAVLAPVPRRAAFRTGFFAVLLATLVLVILYAMAPQLALRFPTAEPTLTAYVASVDALRVWLDGLMQSAAGGLRNLTGEG